MPFALLVIGAVLLVAGVRNRQDDLYTLVKGDFTGQHNFIFWFVAIMVIGSVGYIKPLKPLSNIFLVLIVVVLILANKGGFFSQFTQQIASTQTTTSGNLSPVTQTPLVAPMSNTLNVTDFSQLGVNV